MDEAYIALVAQDWKNGLRFLGKDIVFYGEDKADEKFWTSLFNSLAPQLNIDFHYYTQDINGVSHTGKEMALKFRPHLDNIFMLCLDSDYDYIISKTKFDISSYIFQTYTYSTENYRCFAPSLSDLCKTATQTTDAITFDIEAFLKQYSEIVYPLFIYSVANKIRDFGFSISDFGSTVRLRGVFNIKDNGEAELDYVKNQVELKVAELRMLCPQADYDAAELIIQNKGIISSATYLVIKGHYLYDSVVVPLLKSIVGNIKAQIIKTLNEAGRKAEIATYNNSCLPIEYLLAENNNFLKCQVIEMIRSDIRVIDL
jgi:hypothetical protein